MDPKQIYQNRELNKHIIIRERIHMHHVLARKEKGQSCSPKMLKRRKRKEKKLLLCRRYREKLHKRKSSPKQIRQKKKKRKTEKNKMQKRCDRNWVARVESVWKNWSRIKGGGGWRIKGAGGWRRNGGGGEMEENKEEKGRDWRMEISCFPSGEILH